MVTRQLKNAIDALTFPYATHRTINVYCGHAYIHKIIAIKLEQNMMLINRT